MKHKTSITLTGGILAEIDLNLNGFKSRSEFIEFAARRYLAEISRNAAEQRDLAILNRRAAALNREAEDVLGFQENL